MTRVVSALFVGVALALLSTIGFELDGSSGQANAGADALARMNNPVLPARTPDTRDSGQDLVATILGRPLFNRDRRPPPIPEEAALPTNELPRLAGILVTPFGNTAIFAAVDGGKPMVVSEGSHVGKFIVKSIAIGQVTMIGPEGQRLLHPSFDGVSATVPPVPTGSTAPRDNVGQIRQGAAN
jgi:hypothetical protein